MKIFGSSMYLCPYQEQVSLPNNSTLFNYFFQNRTERNCFSLEILLRMRLQGLNFIPERSKGIKKQLKQFKLPYFGKIIEQIAFLYFFREEDSHFPPLMKKMVIFFTKGGKFNSNWLKCIGKQ